MWFPKRSVMRPDSGLEELLAGLRCVGGSGSVATVIVNFAARKWLVCTRWAQPFFMPARRGFEGKTQDL